MAKYYPTFSCGHQQEVILFGPHKDRERKIKWLESSATCQDCMRKQHATAGALSTEICRQAGLVDLAGSEKQIGWANQLRVDALKMFESLDAQLTDVATGDDASRATIAEFMLFELDEVRSELLGNAEARWWIDKKDTLTRSYVHGLVTARLRPMEAQIRTIADQERAPISREDQREIYRILRANKIAELAAARKAESSARQAEENEKAAREAEARNAARKEAEEKEARRWASRDATAALLAEAGIAEAEFTVWMRDGEKRIYLDGRRNKITYFATGNKYNRPGSIDLNWRGAEKDKLLPVLAALAAKYVAPVRFRIASGTAVKS